MATFNQEGQVIGTQVNVRAKKRSAQPPVQCVHSVADDKQAIIDHLNGKPVQCRACGDYLAGIIFAWADGSNAPG